MNTNGHHDLPVTREAPPSGAAPDVHGTIRFILDNGMLLLICLALAIAAGTVYILISPSLYEATATLDVQQPSQRLFKENQEQLFATKNVEIAGSIAQKLEDPALLEKVLEKAKMLPPNGEVVTNSSGALVPREKIVKAFGNRVNATLRHNTFLIDVVVRNTHPKLAAELANLIVETYFEQDALLEQTMAKLSVAPLRTEADQLMKNLEVSEQNLQNYRKQVGSVSLDSSTQDGSGHTDQSQNIITPDLQNLNRLLSLNSASLVLARGAYQDSLRMGTNIEQLLAYPQVATNSDVVQTSTQLAQQKIDFGLIRLRYRAKNPKYILAESSVAALQDQLAATVLRVVALSQESLRIAYQSALTAQQGLEAELTNVEKNVLQLDDDSVHFNVLARKVASDQALYDTVIKQVGETEVSAQVTPEKIRIIRFAAPSEIPVSPKKLLIFAMVIFAGLGIGVGLTFALDSVQASFRTVEEIEQQLTLPVLVAIPKLKTKGVDSKPLFLQSPTSEGVEVFRILMASMAMLSRGKSESEMRTFLFTSSLPNEGKSFVSINHATSLAQKGLRTLLVDADLRNPMIEKFFSGKTGRLPGVFEFFETGGKLIDLCMPCKDIPNLFWISAGRPVTAAAELLSRVNFKNLLDEGLLHFDRIIIDAAPLLPVSDTLFFVDKADAVGLVVRWGKTSRQAVQRSVCLLTQAEALIEGLVLNLVPNHISNNYYYGSNYGGGYEKYAGHESKEKTNRLINNLEPVVVVSSAKVVSEKQKNRI